MTEVVVQMCDPRDRESEIKALFARNGQPGFAAVFDRAYRQRAEHGLRSWVGMLDGQAVMHVAVSPLRFAGAGLSLQAGVLGDLMVDESQRDFWAPVRLLRRMVADMKQNGNADFLLSTTVHDAESVFKAGGFKPLGVMRRYLLPTYWPYLAFSRLRGRVKRARFRNGSADEWNAGKLSSATAEAEWLRPETHMRFYNTRIPRLEFADANWISVGGSNGGTDGWALLSKNPQLPSELGVADLFWQEDRMRISEVLHAAARWTRKRGFNKLTFSLLGESAAAQQMEKIGFLPRDRAAAVVVQPVKKIELPAADKWFLPGFTMSSW
jgi:hypothetical protein